MMKRKTEANAFFAWWSTIDSNITLADLEKEDSNSIN